MSPIEIILVLIFGLAVPYGLLVGLTGKGVGAHLGTIVRRLRSR